MWRNKKSLFLILPALMVTTVLFFGGLWEGFVQSISIHGPTQEGKFTLEYYKDILSSLDFWYYLFFTLRIAFITTVLCTMVSIIVLYLLFWMRSYGSSLEGWAKKFFEIPMLFPYVVAAYMIFLIFSPSGWLSRILYNLGMIDAMEQFPILVNDSFGWGIILAYVWKMSPFMVVMLYPLLLKIEKNWLDVGRVLGASKIAFFKEVVFPMLVDPLKIIIFIVFSYSLLDYEIPYMLGVTYPKTLSVASYQLYMNGALSDRSKALAIYILSTMLVVLHGIVFYFVTKKNRGRKRQKI